MSNQEIAQLLKNVAAVYEVLGGNRFKIIAYRRAADSVERLTSELKDFWDEGKLEELPGIGTNIASHLDELFKTGKARHFERITKRVPREMFVLLKLSMVGPKTAYRLAKEIDKTYKSYGTYKTNEVLERLEELIKTHKIARLEGFGEKREQEILEAIHEYRSGQKKEKRLLLAFADQKAREIIAYLEQLPSVLKADPLGSLRRRVVTVGDIDIAVATDKPQEVINHFLNFPKKEKILEKGDKGATIILQGGVQVDLRVSEPSAYGAMLQYFTGSKEHNIRLRELALKKGLSLSEYGIRKIPNPKSQIPNGSASSPSQPSRAKSRDKFQIQNSKPKTKLLKFAQEDEFYNYLGLDWIPPELRENQGEIEAAFEGKLPKLVELDDIRGDLHLHSNYQMPVSHDLGISSLENLLKAANRLGYEYIGLADHNPKQSGLSTSKIISILKRRRDYFEQKIYRTKSVQNFSRTQKVYNMLEIDIIPNGKLALPDEAFEYVDSVIASIHSNFKMERLKMTERILKGLSHPKVRIFGHPTARMIGQRESLEADWEKIFRFCQEKEIALEVNAWPGRLDLPDFLVREAIRTGVKLMINTDSHQAEEMGLMEYGVSVARRGWATERDIINTLPLEEFEKWLQGR